MVLTPVSASASATEPPLERPLRIVAAGVSASDLSLARSFQDSSLSLWLSGVYQRPVAPSMWDGLFELQLADGLSLDANSESRRSALSWMAFASACGALVLDGLVLNRPSSRALAVAHEHRIRLYSRRGGGFIEWRVTF